MTRALSQSDAEGLVTQPGQALRRAASSARRTLEAQTASAPPTSVFEVAIQPCAVSAVAGSGTWNRSRGGGFGGRRQQP